MKKLIFATNNEHKEEEIRNKLGGIFEISTLKEIGCTEEIPEDSGTLEGNALQKAHYLYNNYGCNCFADDTGLEVEVLNNEPGVYSARYAGESKDSEANMDKLLYNLKDKSNRNARFRTVIALIIDGKEYLFEGIAKGIILTERHGSKGFGYDPIFQPDGYNQSFAELTMDEKNRISHRGKAVEKLIEFLSKHENIK
ncbi:MAG: non-canonical purine NTP diphosphatase [Paludibacteraceae bacterium]|nr:non-canonical purine NTP diphosphatase [Paludibacteraceae bacterium]